VEKFASLRGADIIAGFSAILKLFEELFFARNAGYINYSSTPTTQAAMSDDSAPPNMAG